MNRFFDYHFWGRAAIYYLLFSIEYFGGEAADKNSPATEGTEKINHELTRKRISENLSADRQDSGEFVVKKPRIGLPDGVADKSAFCPKTKNSLPFLDADSAYGGVDGRGYRAASPERLESISMWKLRARELSVMQDHIDERNSCFFFNNQ